jgi:choline kinase
MKTAIILCAGSARRFFAQSAVAPSGNGDNQPKCLLALSPRDTILDRLLASVLKRNYHVILGTGCGHAQVTSHLAAQEYSDVESVFNPDFATTNSIVTLWKLRHHVGNQTLLINGDLVVGDAAFDCFESSREPQLLVTRLENFDDDSYRVVFDDEYSIARMGKDLNDAPSKNCVAFTGISRVGNAELFLREIEKLLESGARDTWPTTAYRNLIGEIPVYARDIGSIPFFDVDTPEEHEAARAFLQTSLQTST